MEKSIFIAATGQNVGKTTLCLGIMAVLRKKFDRVGFIKPVGQQHVRIHDKLKVDKDVVLFKDHFQLANAFEDMSPVILPAGFTRDFLDGKLTAKSLEIKIENAYQKIASQNDFTLIEGTGHVGVGSIVGLNNAKVAKLLGADVVLIASGGLGSAYDELALNVSLCKEHGVSIRGIILNRVIDEKREMIEDYFPKALKEWNVPLIGCVPYNQLLSLPTLRDFETLFETQLIAGKKHQNCHFPHHRLVAGSLEAYVEELLPYELIITPGSREDIILATLEKHEQLVEEGRGGAARRVNGMILTSRYPPSLSVLERIRKVDFPALYTPICSYDAMKMITSFTAKIRLEDQEKIDQAIRIVEENLNFDLLLNP